MINGTTVTLINLVQTGTDAFGAPIYNEVETDVNDVLVAPSSNDDIVNALNLWG